MKFLCIPFKWRTKFQTQVKSAESKIRTYEVNYEADEDDKKYYNDDFYCRRSRMINDSTLKELIEGKPLNTHCFIDEENVPDGVNGQVGLSNYQVGAMTRDYNGCDQCHRDRKRCVGGVPCSRCTRTWMTCTSKGVSQRQALSIQMQNVYGPNCFFAKYINKSGYYVIFTNNGQKFYQRLDDFFQPQGNPTFIGLDRDLDVYRVQYNVDFTIDDLINAGGRIAPD